MLLISDSRKALQLLVVVLLSVVSMFSFATTDFFQSIEPNSLLFITVLAILLVTVLAGFVNTGLKRQWLHCLVPIQRAHNMDTAKTNHHHMENHFRWQLTLVFVSICLICALGSHLWLDNRQINKREYVEAVSGAYLNTLSQSLGEAFSSAYTLGLLIKHNQGSLDDFEDIAWEMLGSNPGLSALQLVPDGIISATIPKSGNEAAINHNLMTNPVQLPAVNEALESRQLTISGPFELVQGGVAAIARQPVYLQTDEGGQPLFWGFTAALIRFPDIIDNIGLRHLEQEGIAYELWNVSKTGERQTVYRSSILSISDPMTLPVMVPNGEWMLSVAPVDGWISTEYFVIALLISGLIILVVTSAAASILHQPIRLQQEVDTRTDELLANESNFRKFFENNRSVMMLIDPDNGQIQQANEAASEFYGYSSEELTQCPISSINAMSEEEVDRARQQALSEERNYFQFQHRMKDGSIKHVEVYSTPIHTGPKFQLFSIIHDVSERHELETEMRLANNVFTHASEAIVVMDPAHKIIRTNAAFHTVTGVTKENALNQALLRAINLVNIDESSIWQEVDETGSLTKGFWGMRPNDESYAVLLTLNLVRDKYGKPQNYIGLFSDITEIKQQEKKLTELAKKDSLTRLPNRSLFLDRLRTEIRRTARAPARIAVLFLDLDEFKIINDTWGHPAGDRALNTIAARLRTSVRENDTVARVGGDEFLVLLTDLSSEDMCAPILNRLLVAASSPIVVEGTEIRLSASIGVAFYPDNGNYAEQLIRQADHAMYRSKQLGRNRYTYFSETEDIDGSPSIECARELDKAIGAGELRVFYQPKVNLHNGEVSGFEALIRWQHPEKGLMNPAAFIKDIEGHEVFVRMDNWVLETVFKHLAAWQEQGFRTSVGVNVSAKQLQNPNFPGFVRSLLNAHPTVEAEQIEFEILESSALQDLTTVSETVQEFSAIGIEFALDDFGTGFSTLKRLQRLPVRALKIDIGFVLDMLHDPSSLALVKGVLALADAFNLRTVAEGVENKELGETLIRLGCKYGQGYGIAKPMPEEKVLPWYQGWCYPEEWQRASEDKNGPEESILVAEVEHRAWMRSFTRYTDEDPSQLPEMNSSSCAFGRWCQTEAFTKYGENPLFTEVVATHHKLHMVARELLSQPADKRDMQTLEQISRQLLALLRRLPVRSGAV